MKRLTKFTLKGIFTFFSELFMDPDYPLSKTLIKKVQRFSFKLNEKIDNFFYYTLKFKKNSHIKTKGTTTARKIIKLGKFRVIAINEVITGNMRLYVNTIPKSSSGFLVNPV